MLPFFGSATYGDFKMDTRNNALGTRLLKKAGINSTPRELAKAVDQEVFKQLDRILGRSEEQRNFKSPEGGLDVYFPRDKQGYFDTSYIYD